MDGRVFFVGALCFIAGLLTAGTTQVDLQDYFDRDTILCPADPAGAAGGDFDGLDAGLGTGYALVVEGWDGTAANAAASGPLEDGVVADFQLGPCDGPNAIHISTDDQGTDFLIEVPQGSYRQVRFLVSAGDGDCDIPVVFEYTTGASQEGLLICDDWFDDYPDLDAGGVLREGLATVADGWDRVNLTGMAFEDNNDPGVFACTIPLDPERELTAIVLKPGDEGTWFERPIQASPTALNLYAVNLDSEQNQVPEADITADPSEPDDLVIDNGPVEIVLECTATDPDEGPLELTYSWGLESAPGGANVVFIPVLPVTDPEVSVTVDLAGTYVFGCNVSDGAQSVKATISLAVGCANKVPEIDIQLSSASIASGGTATADASATVDPDEGPSDLTYHWEYVAGAMEQIDLTDHFNADGVFEPGGDYLTSGIDQSGHELVVDGFNGVSEGNANAAGLPADGSIGFYQLAPYDGLNIVQLSQTSVDDVVIEFETPRIASRIFYLVTGGNGDSDVVVDIEYQSGEIQTAAMHCDDWFDDTADGTLRDVLQPVINDLDRTNPEGAFLDVNDPALFQGEILLEEPGEPIVAITLKPSDPGSVWAGTSCILNLFDLWLEKGEVVIDSPDGEKTDIRITGEAGEYLFRLTVDDGDLCTGPVSSEFAVTVGGGIGVFTGDVNSDGSVNIADAIAVLSYQFAGAAEPLCMKNADANDDGSVNIADAVTILGFQFAGGEFTAPDGVTFQFEHPGCVLYDAEDVSDLGCGVPCR